MIQNENKDEIEKMSASLRRNISYLQTHFDRLDNIEEESKSIEEIESTLRQFVYYGEQIYKETLSIGEKISIEKDAFRGENPLYELLDNRYKISGNPVDGFEIIMPMLPRKFESEKFNQTRIMAEIVHEITSNYLEKEGITTPVFEKAKINYEVNIGPDKEDKRHIPDGDNLDTKHVTDALQQLLFPSDNLLVLDWSVSGKNTEEKSFIRVQITGNGLQKEQFKKRQNKWHKTGLSKLKEKSTMKHGKK